MTALYVSQLDACPVCAGAWAYEVDGNRYSKVIAVVVNDRAQVWRCPHCSHQWPIGAAVNGSMWPTSAGSQQ